MPPDAKVRNPRYAGATIGDLVRGLMRPKKPKEKPAAPPEPPASGMRFQRPKK